VTYTIAWQPVADARLQTLAKDYAEAPDLIGAAVNDLASNPRPTNSTQLGTSSFRRLLLGYWRVTYEVVDENQTIHIHIVGRSENPR
jgi:mRNA interferase RelE/StbE